MPGLPRGLLLRRPTPADLDVLVALCQADERHSLGRVLMTRAEVAEMLSAAHTSLQRDQWLAVTPDGAVAAWALVVDGGNTNHQQVDVYRHPARAGEDVRGALLDLALQRLAQRADDSGYPCIVGAAGCYVQDTEYAATLQSRGLVHVRTFHQMRRELAGDQAVPTPVPDGLRVEPFDGTEESWVAMHRVVQTSFAEHFGYAPVAYRDYRAEVEATEQDRPLWRMAWAGETLVGVLRASGRNAELDAGHVAELAVLPEHRRRGVARALLAATFEASRRAGRTWVGLGVDAENETGAVRLYESVGMRVQEEIRVYQTEVRPSG